MRVRQPILIIAHPGHELLLRHWLATARPTVFALSDGSGSTGKNRSAYSRRFISALGARTGTVFGAYSDRDLYRFLREGRTDIFRQISDQISEAALKQGCDQIVCDAVEHYNPMHDIANIIAHFVSQTVAARTGIKPDVLTSDIRGKRPHSQAHLTVAALPDEIGHKLDAAMAYFPLADEVADYRDKLCATGEALFDDPGFDWPEALTGEVFYERYGAGRVAEGTYRDLITYRDHVRPLALDMLGSEACA